jgi:hypothetical protein
MIKMKKENKLILLTKYSNVIFLFPENIYNNLLSYK